MINCYAVGPHEHDWLRAIWPVRARIAFVVCFAVNRICPNEMHRMK